MKIFYVIKLFTINGAHIYLFRSIVFGFTNMETNNEIWVFYKIELLFPKWGDIFNYYLNWIVCLQQKPFVIYIYKSMY